MRFRASKLRDNEKNSILWGVSFMIFLSEKTTPRKCVSKNNGSCWISVHLSLRLSLKPWRGFEALKRMFKLKSPYSHFFGTPCSHDDRLVSCSSKRLHNTFMYITLYIQKLFTFSVVQKLN